MRFQFSERIKILILEAANLFLSGTALIFPPFSSIVYIYIVNNDDDDDDDVYSGLRLRNLIVEFSFSDRGPNCFSRRIFPPGKGLDSDYWS